MPIFRFPFFYNPNNYNRFTNSRIYNFARNETSQYNQYNNHNPNYINSNGMNKTQNSYSHNNSNNNNNNNNNRNNNYSSALNYGLDSSYQQLNNKQIKVDKKNNSKSNNTDENYFFELFGLELYFDDILLICLIFFLYQEGVKDDELFLSLILLLLS